jgi:hypothetical protein
MSDDNGNSIIKRKSVSGVANYHDYKQNLRNDFLYSCGYCSITEVESTGRGFQIDHYLPQEHFPEKKNEYENLIWSCEICNSCKSDYYANEDHEKRGFYIIRPDNENPYDHYELKGLLLKDKTVTGEFNITWLRLNRKILQKIRELRKRYWDASEYIALGMFKINQLNLDQIPKTKRIGYVRLREGFNRQIDTSIASINSLIEENARSFLLDEDAEKDSQLRKRKKFLDDNKVILPRKRNDYKGQTKRQKTKKKKR